MLLKTYPDSFTESLNPRSIQSKQHRHRNFTYGLGLGPYGKSMHHMILKFKAN
jgi:hypothetical protein